MIPKSAKRLQDKIMRKKKNCVKAAALTIVAIVVDSRRVRTGELLIQSDRAGLLVTLRRDGRIVQSPTGNRSFTLPAGEYEVGVDGREARRIKIVRGERSVFKVADPR